MLFVFIKSEHPYALLFDCAYFCEQNGAGVVSFEGIVKNIFFHHQYFQVVCNQCGFLWTCTLELVTMEMLL